MARFPFGPFIRGLATLVDNIAGDPSFSPDCQDVRGHRGCLFCRKGYRILVTEPSHKQTSNDTTKQWGYLGFDGVNDYATNASWTQTLGTKWTIRAWIYAVSLSGVNNTDGTRTILHITAATHEPVRISLIGVSAGGGTSQIRAIVKDNAGNTITLTGTARTTTAWVTLLGNHTVAFIRLVRDGATLNLYVGENLEATSSAFTTNAHEAATSLWVGAASGPAAGTYSNLQVLGLTIVNRVLTEYENYWLIGWPTDAEAEPDVLGNWPFIERSGTTVTDYSSYGKDLTITGATYTGALFGGARGLGLFSWRRANGDIYHAYACTMRGTSSAGANPSGKVYTWKASTNFLPFYTANDPGADDATSGLSGLDPFARVSFAQGRDMLLLANGRDFCRKYQSSFQYMGGTAPPAAPILSLAAASPFTYAVSYYNSVTKTETGLSPVATASAATGTIQWILSSDTQFDKVRIYRSKTGETLLYLHSEQAMAAGAVTDTITDADLVSGPLCPGSDLAGNRAKKRAYLSWPVGYGRLDDPQSVTAGPPGGYSFLAPQKGPGTAPTVGSSAGGSLSAGTYRTGYSFYDSVNDIETGMSPLTARTVNANDKLDITAMVVPPEAARYDQMRIYCTIANGKTLYLDQTISAAASATVSQSDATRATLGTIETRALPPRAEYLAVFANRLWMAYGTTLAWSTTGSFEDFPEPNAYSPKAGVRITGISPTEGALFVHFEDGTIHLLPHPGDEDDLIFFVPLNLRQWSPRGATVGHYTVQAVPGGLLWLSRDGFYFASPTVLALVSPQISPDFLNLNGSRGRYACSLYDGTRGIYRCWLSRGNNRLNEECFVGIRDRESGWLNPTWWLDNIHADAAGILYDAKSNPHFCFIVENGILCELDETLDLDGDGSGTLSGTVSAPTISSFTAIGSRTAPTGGDGGYHINLLKSDGTFARRMKLEAAMDPRGGTDGFDLFYPSLSGLTSGSWTAYFHGIRGYWKTMQLYLAGADTLKSLTKMFFFHGKESAGGLQVNTSLDDAAMAAANQDVDLTKNGVSQITGPLSFRRVQVEFYSDPPAASRPWKVSGITMHAEVTDADIGT